MTSERTTLEAGAKCIRLSEMLEQMLTELRTVGDHDHLPPALSRVYRCAQREVGSAIPESLDAELHRLSFDVSDTATVDELRVAQAQLVGWLDGLMSSMRIAVDLTPSAPDDVDERT